MCGYKIETNDCFGALRLSSHWHKKLYVCCKPYSLLLKPNFGESGTRILFTEPSIKENKAAPPSRQSKKYATVKSSTL